MDDGAPPPSSATRRPAIGATGHSVLGQEPLLSLCMIARDEEDEIATALDSARSLVDEMIVYDTGSSDATIAIARERGATVIEGYWDDDFGRARNAALDACRGTWILWLDADESVHGDLAAFRGQLEVAPAELDAVMTPIELLEGNGLAGRRAFAALRVFRREACRFEGRLHEQVLRRLDGEAPASVPAAGLRLLHRGYVGVRISDRAKFERNLRLAEKALVDPAVDRVQALFNYGRTLMTGPEPELGVGPLEEAVELAATRPEAAPVLRIGLQILCVLQQQLGRLDDAAATSARLREVMPGSAVPDFHDAAIALARGEFASCLELAERLPFLSVDEAGIELGRHHAAGMRARAYAALGRPGEAADALLEALRTWGVLDEPLDVLVGHLLAAERPLSELAGAIAPDLLPVFAASAGRLPAAQADVVLCALHERFPDRLEPLAVAVEVAPRLPVVRALWWSATLRRRGWTEPCPLVTIACNAELDLSVRLRAAAAAFGSFADQRVIPPARTVLGGLDEPRRAAALAEVAALSATLAGLLSPAARSAAVLITLDGERRDGFFSCTTSRGTTGATVVEADRLPLRRDGAHLLVARGALAALDPARTGSALDEWARVLQPGGELVVEVPDLEELGRRLVQLADGAVAPEGPDSDTTGLLRALYGARRHGTGGDGEMYRTGFTRRSLAALLAGHGFVLDSLEAPPGSATLHARAHLAPLSARLATGPRPQVSLVVVSEHGAAALRRCLTAVAGCDAGATYEVVCLEHGGDPAAGVLLDSLAGSVTVLRSPLRLRPGSAVNRAAGFATGDVLVLLSDLVELRAGWGRALVEAIGGSAVMAAALILDERGEPCGGPLAVRGEARTPLIEARPEPVGPPDALGSGCVAISRVTWQALGGLAGGLELEDATIDLSLRARRLGELRAVRGLSLRRHGAPESGGSVPPAADEASRCELAHRWCGQLDLEPPASRRVTLASLLPSTTLLERIASAPDLALARPRPGGCNLVGDFDAAGPTTARVRSWRGALDACAMPVSLLGYATGRVDATLAGGEVLAYDTTVLCLSGDELTEYVARVGLDSLRERYTVLDWHWPFATAAPSCAVEAGMVSEIWVPSAFTQRALREATARPLRLMPPPVLPAAAAGVTRRDLGLRDGFVFATLAEVGRGRPGEVELANPVGLVEAFCAAFPRRGAATLYIGLCGSRTEAVATACREAAAGRADVIVGEDLDAERACSVIALADCYASLHRSCAFGPALATALVSGVPVVASGVGGALDYLDDSSGELVGTTPATTTAAHAPYPAGLPWGEPDLEDAAAALFLVHEEPERARLKARAGALRVGRVHGAELAGRMLRRRVETVAPLRSEPVRSHRGRRRARR
jgi:glycosyltransferase involved in cell wall biosynthesis/tetratricopeptide (TPR) repeat protein